MSKDITTRAQAKKLFKSGFPWGEAVSYAVEHDCKLDWQLATDGRGNTRRNKEETEKEDRGQKRKSPEEKPKEKKPSKEICQDFNSPKGCTKKERNCPTKGLHKCSRCGHFSHGVHKCRRR